MSNIPKDRMISLSSWNYGSYSYTNPFYNKMNFKSQPIKIYQNEYSNNCNNSNQKNEKIVKNIYFENLDYMKYISRDEKDKNKQRPKSARNNNKSKDDNNNNTNINTNNNKEFRITFDKWLENKNKKIRSMEKLKKEDLEKKKLEEEEKKMP